MSVGDYKKASKNKCVTCCFTLGSWFVPFSIVGEQRDQESTMLSHVE
jgi:hypothetical protein